MSEKNAPLQLLKRWGPLVIICLLLVVAYLAGLQKYLTLSNLIQQRGAIDEFVSQNYILAIGAYALIYIILVAISFPGGLALSITSGLIFGWFVAGTVTVIAATLGAIIVFMVARSSFGDFFKGRTESFLGKMVEGFRENAFQYLLTLRLVPVFPFWVVNIVPGLLNMKLWPYAMATFIGIIPGTFAFTYLGEGLDSVIAEQEKANPGCAQAGTCSLDPKSLVTTQLVVALLLLAALSFLPVVLKKFSRTKVQTTGE